MATAEVASDPLPKWRIPWQTGGLGTLVREPRLLWIFTRAEMRDRYQGTLLGKAWDYMRPLTRFFVYYVVIGILFGITKAVPNFGIYIFSGVLVVQIFISGVQSGTKSLSRNTGLIRRVNIPRQVIPLRLGPGGVPAAAALRDHSGHCRRRRRLAPEPPVCAAVPDRRHHDARLVRERRDHDHQCREHVRPRHPVCGSRR